MNKLIIQILFATFFLVLNQCTEHNIKQGEKLVAVPNDSSAIRIAEKEWLKVYGDKIYENQPFIAKLIDGKKWVVYGTLSDSMLGGTPYIEISRDNGKIIKITHGK